MSTENEKSDKRPYRLKKRARKQAETRRRITEAVVELHKEVGPAKTTVSEVAERAGVGRMTVYKHFPTESDLFRACGSHWSEQNPLPDFSDCLARPELGERAASVFERLYIFYRHTHDMLGKIMRDAPLLPALQETLDSNWAPAMRQLEEALIPGGLRDSQRKRVRAAIRLALNLHTWESLTENLSDRQAARLSADIVQTAAA